FGPGLMASTWLLPLAEAAGLVRAPGALRRLRAPPERVLIAAWHPLAVSEIAGNGHVDALAVLAGAVLLAAAASGRRGLAGAAVALGTLVKLGPLLLVPVLARWGGRRFAAVTVAVRAAGYAVYLSAGWLVIGTTPRLLREENVGSLAWWALEHLLGGDTSRVIVVGALLAGVAVVSVRAHESVDQFARTCLFVLGGELLATNYLQPWYALWLLPFLVV